MFLLHSQVVLRLYSPLCFPGITGENLDKVMKREVATEASGTGMSDRLLSCSQVKLDVLQSAKTLSLQS